MGGKAVAGLFRLAGSPSAFLDFFSVSVSR